MGSWLETCARTDDDVLPELVREHVRLAHLRVGHPARDEHEHPLARFGRCVARARCAVPAGLGTPQRGCRCGRWPGQRGWHSLRVVFDVRKSSRVEPA
jgi:hypothetical protein